MSSFANSADPDEMQHNAAFHQGLQCLLRLKRYSDKEMQYLFNYNLTPIGKRDILTKRCNIFNNNLTPLDIYNGPSQDDCIISGGRTNQNAKSIPRGHS